MKIGDNISSLRKANGMTQERLSECLGVSIAAVSKWETAAAYPDIELLPKIAGLFCVSVDFLLGYELKNAELSVENEIKHAMELFFAKKSKEALEALAYALARRPNNTKLRLAHARLYVYATYGANATPKQKEYLNSAEKILLSLPKHELTRLEFDEANALLCELYRLEKHFDKAFDCLEKLRQSEFVHPVRLEYNLYLDMGDCGTAAEKIQNGIFNSFTEISRMFSCFYRVYYDNPKKIIELGKLWLRVLDAITQEEPSPYFNGELSSAHECLAYMYIRLGDRENSLLHFEKATSYALRSISFEKGEKQLPSCFDRLDGIKQSSYDGVTALLSALNSGERKEYELVKNDERFRACVESLSAAKTTP